MPIEVLSDPFADTFTTDVDEAQIRDVAPNMPDTKVQDLLRAAGNERWSKQQGLNEKFMFDKEYMNLASNISAELGPFTLDTFEQAQNLVSAGVLRIINEGDRTGSFRGENASGGSQWDLEGINSQTFGGAHGDRVYKTDEADADGVLDLAPGVVGEPDEGEGRDGVGYLDDDTQVVFVLGHYASTNPRALEHVQYGIDDGEDRTAQEVYSHQQLGSLQAHESPSAEYITDDDAYDINASVAQEGVETDFFPFGVDINTAAKLTDLGVQQ